jgi:hypothetical protein
MLREIWDFARSCWIRTETFDSKKKKKKKFFDKKIGGQGFDSSSGKEKVESNFFRCKVVLAFS